MLIPIFIHVREKSDKEIKAERERDERMRKAIEEDERRRRERKQRIEEEKRRKEDERRKRLEDEYYKSREKNPWDYQFMPEGWSIFGQTIFTPITDI